MNGSHEASNCRVPWKKIKADTDRTSNLAKGKAPVHYVVAYCNIGVTEDLLNTSFASWGNALFLCTGATSHMTFQGDFFKEFDDLA